MKMQRIPLLVALLSALAIAPVLAQTATPAVASAPVSGYSPANPGPGWFNKLVDLDFVKKHAVVPKVENVMLIDARPAARKYNLGHIPTAINIPDTNFDKLAPTLLPADKATLLVFYCEGYECMLSHNSAHKAEKLGYTNVRVFAEGYPAWQKAYGAGPTAADAAGTAAPKAPVIEAGKEAGTISVASFERIYKEAPDSVYLVDVRDPAEMATGTFNGAINFPVSTLEKNLDKLPKDKPIIFFCGAGARSGEAFDMVKLYKPEIKTVFLDAGVKWSKDGTYTIKGN